MAPRFFYIGALTACLLGCAPAKIQRTPELQVLSIWLTDTHSFNEMIGVVTDMTFSNGISIIDPGDLSQTKLVFKFSKLPVDLQDKLIARIRIMDAVVAYELAGITGIVKK